MTNLVSLCVEGAKIIDLCIVGDKLIEEATGAVYNKPVKGVKISKGDLLLNLADRSPIVNIGQESPSRHVSR